MHDVIVQCGCSRKMAVDAIRGRGAFRCGCGARIMITDRVPREELCVAPDRVGRCSRRRITEVSVPLCREHLQEWKAALALIDTDDAQLYLSYFAALTLGQEIEPATEDERQLWRLAHQRQAAAARMSSQIAKAGPKDASPESVVYYLRFDRRVKIGTTTDLRQRLAVLPHDQLLAIEPGGIMLERERHQQFHPYRLHGEWFSMGDELMQHIRTLRRSRFMKA